MLLCHVYKVHGGEGKSQTGQIMDVKTCTCVAVTEL